MSDIYKAPQSNPEATDETLINSNLEEAMRGHNILVGSVTALFILNVVVAGFQLPKVLLYVAVVFAYPAAIYALWKISVGPSWGRVKFIAYLLFTVFPPTAIFSLLLAYNGAAKALKKSGYKMTAIGAKRPSVA